MTIDEVIDRIAAASETGDWRRVQIQALALRQLVRNEGRAIDARAAMRLVEALANGMQLGAQNLGAGDATGVFGDLRAILKKKPLDQKALHASWDVLYRLLSDPTVDVDPVRLSEVMELMKTERLFDLLGRTADRAITRFPENLLVRRLYAQALVDQGQAHAAIDMLRVMEMSLQAKVAAKSADAEMMREYAEVCGQLGRCFKQLYVDNVASSSIAAASRGAFKGHLKQAIEFYAKAYKLADAGQNWWQGINLVALLRLARQDGYADLAMLDGRTAEQLATDIVKVLEPLAASPHDASVLASLGQAHLALKSYDKASELFGRYAKMVVGEPFNIEGTVRQLEEVWRTKPGDGPAGAILSVLKEAQVSAREGKFTLDGDGLGKLLQTAGSNEYAGVRESMVAGGKFLQVALLKTVVERAAAVAALTDEGGKTWGTGFLVRGRELKESLGDKVYLVTNAHVLSCQKRPGFLPGAPLRPHTARIVLEAAGGSALMPGKEAYFQSPPHQLDVCIVPVEGDTSNVRTLALCKEGAHLTPEDPDRPMQGTASGVSVIGCPLGGPLSLSLVGTLSGANGVLVDIGGREREEDPIYLHYRAPTEPGNSGSPVFETVSWTVVGLHHEGFDEFKGLKKLNGKPGANHANEGISINSIRRALRNLP